MTERRTFRQDFEDDTKYAWRPWRWLITGLAVMLVIYLGLAAFTAVTLPFRTAQGVAERVADPDNVIFQYEKFHDACAGIAAKDEQYETALAAAKDHDKRTAGKPDPIGDNARESTRLHQVASGIKLARQVDAQRYNADSRKLTQQLFKAKALPYRIDADQKPDCDG